MLLSTHLTVNFNAKIFFRFGLLILIALDKHVHHQFQYVQQLSLEKKYIYVEFINV